MMLHYLRLGEERLYFHISMNWITQIRSTNVADELCSNVRSGNMFKACPRIQRNTKMLTKRRFEVIMNFEARDTLDSTSGRNNIFEKRINMEEETRLKL
jgi:hypothetical protein